MPLSSEELQELVTAIQTETKEVKGLRSQAEAQSASLDTAKRLTVIAIVTAVIGVLVGVGGLIAGLKAYDAADTAQEAIDQVQTDRAVARVNSCLAENVNIERGNKFNDGIQGIVNAPPLPGQVRTPEQQARLDAILASLNSYKIPPRDCTPEGIDKYLSNQQTNTTTTAPG